jgi:hypothetical protein
MMLWWFPHVGFDTKTFDGNSWLMNSNPSLNEPVPDKAWTVTILPAWTAKSS